MDSNELQRANEIVFIDFIQNLMQSNANPIKVYNFIEATAELAGCNTIIVRDVLNIIMTYDTAYVPTKFERTCILIKQNISVRDTCKLANISQGTYYKYKDMAENLPVSPKFTPPQYEQIQILMENLHRMLQNVERRIV